MKYLFVLSLALLSFGALAQEGMEESKKEFWESAINPIVAGEMEKVVSQTTFPLKTDFGTYDEEKFRKEYNVFFSKEAMLDLRRQNADSAQPVEYGDELTFMVIALMEEEIDGEIMESAYVYSFKKVNGTWMLYQINMAG